MKKTWREQNLDFLLLLEQKNNNRWSQNYNIMSLTMHWIIKYDKMFMKQMNALRGANFLTWLFLFDEKIQFDYMTEIISNKLSKQKIMWNLI